MQDRIAARKPIPGFADEVALSDLFTPASVADQAASAGAAAIPGTFETLMISPDGGVLVSGWIYDLFDPIVSLLVAGPDWSLRFDGDSLARVRRADAAAPMGHGAAHALGYVALGYGDRAIRCDRPCAVRIGLESGAVLGIEATPRVGRREELRDVLLSYLGRAQFAGAPGAMAALYLGRGLGDHLIALNGAVIGPFVAHPYVERFGEEPAHLRGSIVVCLYGKTEYLFLQAALFGGLAGMGDYEFVYVLNSPELADAVLNEARLAAFVYGLAISVVVLAGNAGFAAANNAAAEAARSDRLIFLNPDVLPRDKAFALKHSALLLGRPSAETTVMGSTLYYDDGALMHGGMYLELDQGVEFERGRPVAWDLLRVEHYGKGAPPERSVFARARAVTAVTGAFMSLDRRWFEALGGFCTDYVFGHYEDADLCLRSLQAGVAPWVHDLGLWHLEGKGSTRHGAHEGAMLANRWLFTARWARMCEALLGRRPAHPLLGGGG